ncbi:hypothetical protein BGZ59_004694 [Podila verticillata]|nr:hypothetical protein BGZ59_004694 [Podila verticillata]KAI9238900.1 MAG: hypothetical protein BYD32DRAFT_412502 [Podila humilis]
MHFPPALFFAAVLALASSVMADLSITAPNTTSFVRAGGQLPISWSFSGSYPATISIELVDNSKQLFTGPLALFSNLQTTSGLASWTIPKLGFVGDKFSLILVANIGGTATILAQGPEFSIKAEGTPAPAAAPGTSPSSSNSNSWSLLAKAVFATMLFAVLFSM